jgi:hypothetical protein
MEEQKVENYFDVGYFEKGRRGREKDTSMCMCMCMI